MINATIFAPGLTVEVLDKVIVPPPPAQTIGSFIATPVSISAGQSTTLSWVTANATMVKLDGVIVAASGSIAKTPAASALYVLTASGSAPDVSASVAVTVTASAPPPSLTLVRKSPVNTGTVYGGYNFQFCIAAIMAGGKIHQVWNGTNEFDAVTGAWALKTVSTSDGSAVATRPENFGQCFVPGEGVVYQGTQAPGGLFNKFNPVTGVYTNVGGTTQGDSCLLYDAPRNRLITFAGFINPPTVVRIFDVAAQGPWVTLATTNPPPFTFDYSKLTLYRAAISSLGMVGALADGNEVYELAPGATDWTHRVATGTKPPLYSLFAYYEPADAYIAWCGADVVAGANAPAVNLFYALRRSTWTWEQLAVTYPATGPSARSMAQNILLADAERQQVIVLIGNGYTEMWTLDLRGWI